MMHIFFRVSRQWADMSLASAPSFRFNVTVAGIASRAAIPLPVNTLCMQLYSPPKLV